MTDALKHFVVFSQFLLLLFREVLLVARLTFEWQRVVRVLGMLFVENVILPIFPVGEVLLITALSYDRFLLIVGPFYQFLFWLHLEILVRVV